MLPTCSEFLGGQVFIRTKGPPGFCPSFRVGHLISQHCGSIFWAVSSSRLPKLVSGLTGALTAGDDGLNMAVVVDMRNVG